MYFPRLLDLRQDHNLTQQQVADILFCQREVYRRYESDSLPVIANNVDPIEVI